MEAGTCAAAETARVSEAGADAACVAEAEAACVAAAATLRLYSIAACVAEAETALGATLGISAIASRGAAAPTTPAPAIIAGIPA